MAEHAITDELPLDERCFVLGKEGSPLPLEPEPLDREAYNFGVQVGDTVKNYYIHLHNIEDRIESDKRLKRMFQGRLPPGRKTYVLGTVESMLKDDIESLRELHRENPQYGRLFREELALMQRKYERLMTLIEKSYD